MGSEEVVVDCEALLSPQEDTTGGCQIVLELLASALFVAFSCQLLSSFPSWKPETEKDSYLEKPVGSFIRLSPKFLDVVEKNSAKEGCDLFTGKWIWNPSGPTNATCSAIESCQNCLKNGQPDTDYLYWRWQPKSCDLPPFDAGKFLKAMRDKSWAFIGDSILRNQFESLVCLLSKVEEAVEVYHNFDYKTRTWYYSSYNFTLAVIWAPFLVRYESSNKTNAGSTTTKLYLDALDRNWTTEYHMHDYIVISGGQWFDIPVVMLENNQIIGCHNCHDTNIEEIGAWVPYRKALQLMFQFIASSGHKPIVIFRTWTPYHFDCGDCFSERICNRSKPSKEGEVSDDPTDHCIWKIEIEEFEKAAAIGAKEDGLHMKLLDTYRPSLLRPDGRPGAYRAFQPFDKDNNARVPIDCLHRCSLGPINTWNELIMSMVVQDNDTGHASS